MDNLSSFDQIDNKSTSQNVYKVSARYDEHRKDNQTLMTMGSENDIKKEQLIELNKLVAQAEADDSGPAI